jgi:hypothetical protein
MKTSSAWLPVEADLPTILEDYPRPLKTLGDGDVPAFIMRGAYKADHCAAIVERFYERELLYDPRTGLKDDEQVPRIDIGTSLGMRHHDREKFFDHAEETRELFTSLFKGYDDPVDFMYKKIGAMAPGKRVMVAREPDGRLYGPAIFRTYYEGMGHEPHFDSVRDRTRLLDMQVSRFDKQFAAILCMRESLLDDEKGQTLLYRQQWSPEINDKLPDFRAYAEAEGIERVSVNLEPGDFYVFCSETVHELPAPKGERPRVVLAIFFGMSDDDDEIYVWA